MKGLTDYIHGLGLKAGIYTSPGPLTCAGHVGAYKHEEQDVERFVEWGFDFLKYDWCSYNGVAKDKSLAEYQKPYRLISAILAKQPRDIVLNLCQYGMGKVWEWGRQVGGHSWRTAGDLGGSFEKIGIGALPRRLRPLRRQRAAQVRRSRRLERSRLPAAGLSEQLEGRDGAHAADARTSSTRTSRCGACWPRRSSSAATSPGWTTSPSAC